MTYDHKLSPGQSATPWGAQDIPKPTLQESQAAYDAANKAYNKAVTLGQRDSVDRLWVELRAARMRFYAIKSGR